VLPGPVKASVYLEDKMLTGRRIGITMMGLVALSGVGGAVAGCGGSSGSASAPSGTTSASRAAVGHVAMSGDRPDATLAPAAVQGAAAAPLAKSANAAPGLGASSSILPQPIQLPSAVIKTADISIQVPHGKFQAGVDNAGAIAGRFGGYVSQSLIASAAQHSGRVVMRIPAVHFRAALTAIRKLGLKVLSQNVTGQDVTQEFIDLNARLVNLHAQEQVMLRLMNRAQTISESVYVQSQLSRVQLQIEELTGRALYLRNRTALSTITVEVSEAGGVKPAPPHHASTLWKAGARSLHTAVAVVAAVIVGAGFVVPAAVLGLVGFLFVRLIAPRIALRRPAPAAGGED
jgi:Domain of unknown function (DUF4349)